MWTRDRREHGAAAVEMALVLPVLMLVIGGIVDLGFLFFNQITLSNGAREGARLAAIYGYDASQVKPQVELATTGLGAIQVTAQLYDGTTAVSGQYKCPTSPSATHTIQVKVTRDPSTNAFQWTMLNVLPSLIGQSITTPTPSATGTMRCAG